MRSSLVFVRRCSSSSSSLEVFVDRLRNARSLEEGRKIHSQIARGGAQLELALSASIAQMYLDREALPEAWMALARLDNPPSALLTDMVMALASTGDARRAFHVFRRMHHQGIPTTVFVLVPLLKLCSSPAMLQAGRMIHALVLERALDRELFVCNTLITMYRKCGAIRDAACFFWAMPERNRITWNAIVSAFAETGDRDRALRYFHRMQLEGFLPNKVTFVALLSALDGREALLHAAKIRDLVLGSGLEMESSLANALLNACSKNGGLAAARDAFDRAASRDVITWTTMIDAYSESGIFDEALQLFRAMLLDAGAAPNKITFVALLKGCVRLADATFLDAIVRESGYESNSLLATKLVAAFSRCGSPDLAHAAFDRVRLKDVILWTSLITAYAEHDLFDRALRVYMLMQPEGVAPDKITFTTILDVCARSAAATEGKLVHAAIVKSGIELDTALENAILNMYGKCGKMEDAHAFFKTMRSPDILSWSIHIASHAHHGHGRDALHLFQSMVLAGVVLDYSAFVSILSACRHAGLVTQGCEIFHRMVADCGFAPRAEQYGCLVDLLGRSGRLDLALGVLENLRFPPGDMFVIWKAFLSACKEHGDVERAKLAAEVVITINPHDTTTFVVLSNAIVDAKQWLCVAEDDKQGLSMLEWELEQA